IDLDFDAILKSAADGARVYFDSIKITAKSDADAVPLSFRWYDADIPENFPDFNASIVRTKGVLKPIAAKMAGHFYNVSGSGRKGFLAFTHTQRGAKPAEYSIRFSLLPRNTPARGNGPRGWLGDGQVRCAEVGESTTGSGHTRIDLDDWNGDGLIDIIHGEEYGTLFLIPNSGSLTEPKFVHRELLRDASGAPIDVGTHAAPFITDFDNDGVKDLLVGTYTDRLVWFKNQGTNQDRKLVYKGFVTRNGEPFSLPHRPISGPSEGVFNHDYYPVLERMDFNGDGILDYLAGGYVTGRIFVSIVEGKNPDGTPILSEPRPLEIGGSTLNVGDWCAAPTVADFNGDGILDLISGALPMTPENRPKGITLRYYAGSNPAGEPSFMEQPFPGEGRHPTGGLTTPRAADMNGDGLLDLVVSSRQQISIFYNRGTASSPKFDLTATPILLPWTNAPITTTQFVDYNGDGKPDLFNRYVVSLNSGKPAPFAFEKEINLLPRGVRIEHPSRTGDDWFWPFVSDFDGDGDFDILFGDWWGHVWLHRNNGTADKPDYDIEGFRLKHKDGSEIKVGPVGEDPSKSFIALQGARTVLAVADFDNDGLNDLVIGDTFGISRVYRNTGTAAEPHFAPAVELGTVKTRCSVDVTDFDGDGKIDVISGSAGGIALVYRNISTGSSLKFAEGTDVSLPPIKQPRIIMTDLNGDGDDDLFIPGTQGSIWIERSFLKHGYAESRVTKVSMPR
ncbi:MAG TPA: VCBS repeat-containing protein, partial [Tepidisphaeraceae bacterium]|nr:VCBS repeat-containing protein [Tepidisphaeraceae bacterium]